MYLERPSKVFKKNREGRIETIQTTAVLRFTRIPRGIIETPGDLISKTSVKDY